MSIHVHKTGLVKTLGQQSDAIVTANLVGDFQPSAGVQTAYWDNQVSGGNNLRRFNGITHNNSTPHNFQFDGTDDYLGESAEGYGGGDAFTVDVDEAYTIAQWFKHDTGKEHVAFNLLSGSSTVNTLRVGIDTANKASFFDTGAGSTTTFDFTFLDDTWYYIALTKSAGTSYNFYVNGSYIASVTIAESGLGDCKLEIGKAGSTYSDTPIKLGHVHVYNAELTNSQVRQNFLASHVINNTRIYGATYTA